MNLEDRLEAFIRTRGSGPPREAPSPHPPRLLTWEWAFPFPGPGPAQRLYLDIETPGFPSGLPVILAGLARADGGTLSVLQWALEDLDAEPLLLETLARNLTGTLVTYNGTSFDIPRLAERAAYWRLPLALSPHDDLLRKVRCLYRERKTPLSLTALEASLLDVVRGPDIPGEAIGRHFRLYLETGDRRWMDDVARHNRDDLRALALLDARVAMDAEAPSPSPALAFGQGLLRLREGRLEDALGAFLRAKEDPRLRQRAAAAAAQTAKLLGLPTGRHWADAARPLPAPRALLALARAREREDGDLRAALEACHQGMRALEILGPRGVESRLFALLARRARRLTRRIGGTPLT